MEAAKSLRIVPAAAFAGSVAPMISRRCAIAFSRSRTMVTQRPEDMNAQRLPKKGRAAWTW